HLVAALHLRSGEHSRKASVRRRAVNDAAGVSAAIGSDYIYPKAGRRNRKIRRLKSALPAHIPVEGHLMMKRAGWVLYRQQGAKMKLELSFGEEIGLSRFGVLFDETACL